MFNALINESSLYSNNILIKNPKKFSFHIWENLIFLNINCRIAGVIIKLKMNVVSSLIGNKNVDMITKYTQVKSFFN